MSLQVLRIRKLFAALPDSFSRKALKLGVVPTVEHDRILGNLNPSFVFDVGANRGQFAASVRRAYPAVKIVSFEPLPSPLSTLRELFEGDPNFEARPLALSSKPGEAEFHVSGKDDSSSLLRIGELQEQLFSGTAQVATMPVDVSTLALEAQELDLGDSALLKADIQGGEFSLLKGAGEALNRFRYVYLELSLTELYEDQVLITDVVSHLHSHGFALTDIGNLERGPKGTAVQGDFLFQQRPDHVTP